VPLSALVALGTGSLGAMAMGVAAGTPGIRHEASAAESQAAARAAAASVLAAFVPPPGAIALPGEPVGDEGKLGRRYEFGYELGPANVLEQTAWWRVPGTPQQARQYVLAHQPSGVVGVGFPPLGADKFRVAFDLPGTPRLTGGMKLVVQGTQLPGGVTGLRVDAQGVWLTPRPASEVIPLGNTLLLLTTADSRSPEYAPRQRLIAVTDRRRIERVATLLNNLPVVQPYRGVMSCPHGFGVELRLGFHRRHAVQPTAAATWVLDPCGSVQMVIGGRDEPALQPEGDLEEAISRTIGRKLDLNPRRRHSVTLGRTDLGAQP
jgi:hypothetical protein